MDSMFEQFSSGYYLGRLYVQSHQGTRALLRESNHQQVREQLYGSTTESPLVMRYQRQHFVVGSDEELPERTLAVPRNWLSERPDPMEPREVFLAKADRAEQLLQFAAGHDRTDTDTPETGDRPSDTRGSNDATDDRRRRPDRHSPADAFRPRALGDLSRPDRRQ